MLISQLFKILKLDGVETYKKEKVVLEGMTFFTKGTATYNITNSLQNTEGHVVQYDKNFNATLGTITISSLTGNNIS